MAEADETIENGSSLGRADPHRIVRVKVLKHPRRQALPDVRQALAGIRDVYDQAGNAGSPVASKLGRLALELKLVAKSAGQRRWNLRTEQCVSCLKSKQRAGGQMRVSTL